MAEVKKNLTLNPHYTIFIISDGKKIDVTPAMESLGRIDAEGQIAQRVNIQLRNEVLDGVHLSTILKPVNRVFIYADDGEKNDEVFRGFLWDRNYKSSLTDQRLKVTSYDNLIYLQESEDTFFFSAGKSTEEIMSAICKQWNIKLDYSYHNIVNGKIATSGRLYDMMTTDILDVTKRQVGDHYSIISKKDVMYVRLAGDNSETFKFIAGENIGSTSTSWTMEGVITQYILVGKAGDDGREPIDLVESRNAAKYGTLQKIKRRDEDMDIWSAHGEIRLALMDYADPKWEYEIDAPDIPWIRKGDGVYIDAGDIVGSRLIVTAVNRISDNKNSRMTLTMVDENSYFGRQDGGADWFST